MSLVKTKPFDGVKGTYLYRVVVKMNVKIWGAAAIALMIATNAGGAKENIQNSNQVQSERSEARRAERSLSREARAKQKLAPVALDRVIAGCIPVGYADANPTISPQGIYRGITETALSEGLLATDVKGQPLSEGALVCNSLGDTAVVSGGVLTDVIRVAPEDKAEFDSYFQMQQ